MLVQQETFRLFLWGWMTLGLATFVVLLFVSAPYGRHQRQGWGPVMGARWGWVLMEVPCVVIMAVLFLHSSWIDNAAGWCFFCMWEGHYIHRALIYPFRLQASQRTIPWAIVGLGVSFNMINVACNGIELFEMRVPSSAQLLWNWHFICGLVIFVFGMTLNIHSDAILMHLRKGRENGGYKIPRRGAFRWLSCPNYSGEMVEWVGWAMATWSVSGSAFALWAAANLVPRALAHHRWYRGYFSDYPPQRKALIPFVL